MFTRCIVTEWITEEMSVEQSAELGSKVVRNSMSWNIKTEQPQSDSKHRISPRRVCRFELDDFECGPKCGRAVHPLCTVTAQTLRGGPGRSSSKIQSSSARSVTGSAPNERTSVQDREDRVLVHRVFRPAPTPTRFVRLLTATSQILSLAACEERSFRCFAIIPQVSARGGWS